MTSRMRRACAVAAVTATLPASAAAVAVAQEHDGGTPDAGGGGQVVIRATAVVPARVTVLVNERVEWLNVSTREHTVTSNDGLFDSSPFGPNRRFGHTFVSDGSFSYYCRIHPTITGTVDVAHVLLRAPAGTVVTGDEVTLRGRAKPGGGPVTIEREAGGAFAPALTVEPAANGSFGARLTADSSATYRAVSGEQASSPVRVEVLPQRTMSVSAARSRRSQVVRVVVSPPPASAGVHLQRYLKERFGWWTIRRATLTRAGRASFVMPRGSRARVRLVLTKPDGETRELVGRILRLPG